MQFFEYGTKEIQYLSSRDPALGEAIKTIGMIRRKIQPETFSALVYSIISQQISGKAADTVWNRLIEYCGGMSPEKVGKMELSQIKDCGMSMRKARYIKGIAEAALNGSVDFSAFPTMTDKEIVDSLTKLNGVGVWTVEMLLIFSLARPDVLSFHDYGIRKGMIKLYCLESLTKDIFNEYRMKYSPYGSVASLYLWEIAARGEKHSAG